MSGTTTHGPMIADPLAAYRQRPRRRRSGPVWLAAGLLLAVGAGVYLSQTQAWFRSLVSVRSVVIEGNRAVPTDRILEALRVGVGTPWWDVPFGRQSTLLASEPRVHEATLQYRWPHQLEVRVEERVGLLRILSASGGPPLEVSADGVVLDASADPRDLPWLTGAFPEGAPVGQSLAQASDGRWLEQLDRVRRERPTLFESFSEVHAVPGRGFEIYLRDGMRVLAWDPRQNAALWAEVPRILKELDRLHIDDAVLNLRFRDQVVVTPAPDQVPKMESLPEADAEEAASVPRRPA